MIGNCVKKYRIKRDPNIFMHVLGELKNKHIKYINALFSIEENIEFEIFIQNAQRF